MTNINVGYIRSYNEYTHKGTLECDGIFYEFCEVLKEHLVNDMCLFTIESWENGLETVNIIPFINHESMLLLNL